MLEPRRLHVSEKILRRIGLLLATLEEGEDGVKKQRCETDQSANGERDPARFLGL
jgi:hypothetical protein